MESELLTLRLVCAHAYKPDKFHRKCDICGLPKENKVHLSRYVNVQRRLGLSKMAQVVEEYS